MQRTNSQSSSGSAQPCSGSILLNPLPGCSTGAPQSPPPAVSGSLASASSARPRRPSIAVCVSATAEPPAWYQAENNSAQPGTPYGSPPRGSGKSRSNSADRWGVDSDQSEDEQPVNGSRGRLPNGKETSIMFAPLPPGRHRSNSITIGVASRAHMLNAQGGVTNSQQQQYSRQARYAGPQWYQTGGTVPPDVYTYKDLARGLSNVWKKAKKARRPSTASTTSSASVEQALDMERDAKSKGAIEHIEEAEEEHDNLGDDDEEEDDDNEHALADSDSDLEVERGRALGMSMGAFRAGSVESSSSGEASSGALSTSATSAGTGEAGDLKWEAEAAARRVKKGKGKALVQGA